MVSLLVKILDCFGFGIGKNKKKKSGNLVKKPIDATDDKKRANPCSNSEKKPIVIHSVIDNLSLGIRVDEGKMHVLIPRNNKIPRNVVENFYTCKDFQTEADILVYEGESAFTKDNILLGGFNLNGLPPAPKGVTEVKVCFDIDVNGTLKVSAQDTLCSELKEEISITTDQRRSVKISNAKKTLGTYAYDVKRTICDARYECKLSAGEKEKIIKVVNEAIKWLSENQLAKLYEYKDKQKELEVLWNPIITRLYEDVTVARLSSPKVVLEESCIYASQDGSLLDRVD